MEINYSSESPGKVRYKALVIIFYHGPPRFALAGIQYRSTVISLYKKMKELPLRKSARGNPCPAEKLSRGNRTAIYRLDRLARQLGFDQGALGPLPPPLSFEVSQRRFLS